MFEVNTANELGLYLVGTVQGLLIGWLFFKRRRIDSIVIKQKTKSGNNNMSGSVISNKRGK